MKLELGTQIDIQRSDGRVHPAIISGIEGINVTVEWFEYGETKGKEINLEQVYSLNPELAPKTNGKQSVNKRQSFPHPTPVNPKEGNKKVVSPAPRSRSLRSKSMVPPANAPNKNSKNKASYNNENDNIMKRSNDDTVIQSSEKENNKPSTAGLRSKSMIPPANVPTKNAKIVPPQKYENAMKESHDATVIQSNEKENNKPSTVGLRSKSMAPPTNIPINKNSKNAPPKIENHNVIKESLDDSAQSSEKENNKPSTVGQARDRRSNCVKEVERLKKNREDRRARQTEIKKEQIKTQLELDPGNPNWLFLKMIRDFQQSLDDQELLSMDDPIVDHQICVCVRKRPQNKKELNKKDIDIITIPDKEQVYVHECKLKVDLTKYLENQKFRFDYSFDDTSTNELVYRYTARPLVDTVYQQGMATCFAYGQTGSGKTHTMGGDFTQNKSQDCSKGIYALTATDIFKFQKTKYKSLDLVVSASFFEIYSGKVYDLMNKRKKLRVLEDGKAQVQIPNLVENVVSNVQDVLKLLDQGLKTRTSGVTSANQNSSRSHAIFQIILRKRGPGKNGGSGALHGKFSLIDLAGNERGADTISSDRQTRLEGAEINKSLLALKECIRALGRKGVHLPFRASKLTQVLRDSFMRENAKTCMISMISPGMSCTENTMNTLRYADRVKELGPDGPSNKEKKVIDLNQDDYNEEEEEEDNLSNSKSYRNAELATLINASDSKRHNSEDLYNFHEAVSLLIESEEQVIDEHKSSMEENYNYLEEEKKLLERIENDVDCDVEEYVHRLDMILMEKIEKFTALREKVSQFKEQLFEEEKASKNVRRLPFV